MRKLSIFKRLRLFFQPKRYKVTVIGLGGAGCNTINYLKKHPIKGLSLIACDTDSSTLSHIEADTKVQLGKVSNKGLSAGHKYENGKRAVLESLEEVRRIVIAHWSKASYVLIAGMGGGTGSSAIPIIAKALLKKKVKVICIQPFTFEGVESLANAKRVGDELSALNVDIFSIFNDEINAKYGNLPARKAFEKCYEEIVRLIKAFV